MVDVPEWGGRLHIRELNLAERMQLGAMDDHGRIPAWLVAVAACTADGSPLFPDREAAEEMLARKGMPLKRVAEAIMKMSGLGDDDEGTTEGN